MLEAVLVAMIALVILDTDMFKVQVLVSECGDLGSASATIAARDELESRLAKLQAFLSNFNMLTFIFEWDKTVTCVCTVVAVAFSYCKCEID